MKALTISQPFASLIASGEKFVENRRWETFYRGPLAIHAGLGKQYLTAKELRDYPSGCVVATAKLTACLHISTILEHAADETFARSSRRLWTELYNHLHAEGPFCWVLEDITKLPEPIPCKGKQGLWEFRQSTNAEPTNY